MLQEKNQHDYDGAIFYSKEDLSIGYNLKKAEESILKFNNQTEAANINEIIEMYNIIKLINTGIVLESWDADYYERLKKIANSFHAIIGRFMNSFDFLLLKDVYSSVWISYVDCFWEMFAHYNMQDDCPEDIIKEFLSSEQHSLCNILVHRKIVNKYDNILSEYMLSNSISAELLISEYLVKHDERSNMYYFPKSLSLELKKKIIADYINSPNPNPNYLDMIVKGKQCSELGLDDKIRRSAKQKYQEFWKFYFEHNEGQRISTEIIFTDTDEPVSINYDDPFNSSFTFSSNWISDNLDFPTLMNNFIYLFGFVDNRYRSSFPNKLNQYHTIESVIGLKSSKAYTVDTVFNVFESNSTLVTVAYDMELQKHSIRIEDLVFWFFETYLKEEFNIEGFHFNKTSNNSTYVEKSRHICAELESILKQFQFFVEDGHIDRELMEMSSNTPLFSDIKSFNQYKYAYIKDSELINASHHFFSDQSLLRYTERTKSKYRTFYDLLRSESIGYEEFYNYQQQILDLLIEKELLYYDSDKFLRFYDEKIAILRDFYLNEVLCSTYYGKSDYFKYLISTNKMILEGTLFSKPEQDYLDFTLNDRKFDNGPQLRNKYMHGFNPPDVRSQNFDYHRLLKIIVLIVLKINEEICRKDDTWTQL